MRRKHLDFWNRENDQTQLMTHFQHLLMSRQIERERRGSECQISSSTIEEQSNYDFENLIPVINASIDEEDYITPIFNFLSDNFSDLSIVYKLIDYTKRLQHHESINIEAGNFDKSIFELVVKIHNYKKRLGGQGMTSLKDNISACYSSVDHRYFQTNFIEDYSEMLIKNIETMEDKIKALTSISDIVENNRILELTDKFDTFLILMRNLAEIEQIIRRQVFEIQHLRKKNYRLSKDLENLKDTIITKVRRKNSLIKTLGIAKGLSLVREALVSIKTNAESFEFGRMMNLITRCKEIYEHTLKGVKVVETIKEELNKIQHEGLELSKERFTKQFNEFMISSETKDYSKFGKFMRNLLRVGLIEDHLLESNIRSNLREMTKDIKDKMNSCEQDLIDSILISSIEVIFKRVEELENVFSSIVNSIILDTFVPSKSSHSDIQIGNNNIKSLYNLIFVLRKSLLTELEKLLVSQEIHDNMTVTRLGVLNQLSVKLQIFFNIDIFVLLTQNTTVKRPKGLDWDAASSKGNIKGVSDVIHSLNEKWANDYFSSVTKDLESQLDIEDWSVSEPTQKLIEELELIFNTGKGIEEPGHHIFMQIGPKLMMGEEFYYLSRSFVKFISKLAELYHLVFNQAILPYELGLKIPELSNFFVYNVTILLLKKGILKKKLVPKITTKILAKSATEMKLIDVLIGGKNYLINADKKSEQEMLASQFETSTAALKKYRMEIQSKIRKILLEIIVKNTKKFHEVPIKDKDIKFISPTKPLSTIVNSFKEMNRAMRDCIHTQELQSLFRTLIDDLEKEYIGSINNMNDITPTTARRLKLELEWLLNNLKPLYQETIGVEIDNFDVSIKEILFNRLKPIIGDDDDFES